MHVPCRDHPDLGVLLKERERYMELAPQIGNPERMKPPLGSALPDVFDNEKRFVEEHLFRFCLTDTVLGKALPCIALVPLKADNPCEIDHQLYIAIIYNSLAEGERSGNEQAARKMLEGYRVGIGASEGSGG